MDVRDYLIEQSAFDWQKILANWVPPLPEQFTVWLVNRFGDIFAVYEDQTVNWLRIDTGTITRVACNRDQFCDLVDLAENTNEWLLISVVDDCVANGKVLGPGQCYGYKLPPILGGGYEFDNVGSMDLEVYYSFLADIYRQTKDLPDGTKVTKVGLVQVIDKP